MYAIFIPFSQLCWALGLYVSCFGKLCLALHLSVFGWTYVGHWVCLFVCWALIFEMVVLFKTSTAD